MTQRELERENKQLRRVVAALTWGLDEAVKEIRELAEESVVGTPDDLTERLHDLANRLEGKP
jgi:hypothetical protein